MVRESEAGEQATPKGEKKRRFGWPVVVTLLILSILTGLGVREHQQRSAQIAQNEKSLSEERTRLEKELHDAQGALKVCKEAAPCGKAKKLTRNTHRYKVPKPPAVAQARIKEKKFDPRDCGEGTEAVFSKVTGKPECRMIAVAPPPTPAPRVAEAPKQKPEMTCEKPNIRELRDDGSIACIALPATQSAQQAMPDGCLPPDQIGRILCRRTEAKSGSSWVPWALGGAAVVAIIANNRHKGGGGTTSSAVVTNPPRIDPGVTVNPGLPGFTLN